MTGNIVVGHGSGISLTSAAASTPPAPDPETASAVVTGAGATNLNGTYPRSGSMNGRPKYVDTFIVEAISWEGTYWQITDTSFTTLYYYSINDVEYPWLVTTWEVADADEPPPTVTIG